MSKSLPGLPQGRSVHKLTPADAVIAHAFALASQLGLSEADIARSALKAAVAVAQKQGDPDGWLTAIVAGKDAN